MLSRTAFEEVINEQCFTIRRMLLKEKCQEYSQGIYNSDMLIHFKDMQRLTHEEPLLICKMYFLRQVLSLNTQIEYWANLVGATIDSDLNDTKINNRIDDAINYLILMKAIRREVQLNEQDKDTITDSST